MRVYLIHYNGVGALVKLEPRDTSADEYGRIQRDFAVAAGASPDAREYAEMIDLLPFQIAESLFYDSELAGPDGASYRLIRMPTTGDDEVERAKAHIRRSFDVVSLRVVAIRRLIDFAA